MNENEVKEIKNEETEKKVSEAKEKSWKQIILENVAVIVLAVIVGLLAKNFIGVARVCGHSMESTLKDGDYMLLNRTAYKISSPNYGDIVVTNSPLENGKKKLIKRVIGLPGDKIVVKDGHVYRNDKQLQEDYIKEQMIPGEFVTEVVPQNKVFVMGDNRNDSLDSRSPSVSTLDVKKDIIGKCYFDISKFKTV